MGLRLIMDLETRSRQNHLRKQSWRAVLTLAYQRLGAVMMFECGHRRTRTTEMMVENDAMTGPVDEQNWVGYWNLGSIDCEIQTIGALG
uniref:Uncharacterized protein n=1 Tax=Lactuca sativa TaxID=4236 RepID=A0A9R1XJD9_LACSA|nr:hypothetical protein LSAT_V11C400200340 [Lactuca sativa]